MWKRIEYKSPKASVQKAVDSIVLQKLRAFLDANEPDLVYWLTNLQRAQGKAITYKEIREAILSGDVSADLLDEWQQDYAKFVKDHLEPLLTKAIEAAAAEVELAHPGFYFEPMSDGVQAWVEQRGAEFVTSSTATQIEGLRAVVRRAAVLEDINVDTLARAIRPLVGLYYQQGVANMRYFEKLIKNGTSEKKALDLAARYGARQHRYRGYLIARTELAFAYNKGADEGVRQAQRAGYMGETVKVWSTALDERVCKICGPLEGRRIAMDEEFNFPTKLATTNPGIRLTPPAHPSCRCAVEYREIGPPIYR